MLFRQRRLTMNEKKKRSLTPRTAQKTKSLMQATEPVGKKGELLRLWGYYKNKNREFCFA